MNKEKLQILDDDGNTIVIRGGITIVFNASDGVTVYTSGDVKVRPPTNDDAPPKDEANPRVGDRMPDGTIYAGTSPDTGRPMYTTPADAFLTMKWREAMNYAANLEAHGQKDWRLPSQAELNVLFNNRAAIGGFDTSGSFPAGYYWSSSEDNNSNAWDQRFSDGDQGYNVKSHGLSGRCVRR